MLHSVGSFARVRTVAVDVAKPGLEGLSCIRVTLNHYGPRNIPPHFGLDRVSITASPRKERGVRARL
eukprot:7612353-Lingulodinium_polyedra.AAC.1